MSTRHHESIFVCSVTARACSDGNLRSKSANRSKGASHFSVLSSGPRPQKCRPQKCQPLFQPPSFSVLRYSAPMTPRAILVASAIFAMSATGCCKACSAISGIAKEIAGPEASEGERLVKERVTKDDKLRKRICGVDTKELTNLVVKKTPEGRYSIEGTPVERPMVKPSPAKPDGGAPSKSPVDPKRLLVCAAVVSLMWDAKEDASGTTWSIRRVDVEEITTPGAEYKRPPSSGDWD